MRGHKHLCKVTELQSRAQVQAVTQAGCWFQRGGRGVCETRKGSDCRKKGDISIGTSRWSSPLAACGWRLILSSEEESTVDSPRGQVSAFLLVSTTVTYKAVLLWLSPKVMLSSSNFPKVQGARRASGSPGVTSPALFCRLLTPSGFLAEAPL